MPKEILDKIENVERVISKRLKWFCGITAFLCFFINTVLLFFGYIYDDVYTDESFNSTAKLFIDAYVIGGNYALMYIITLITYTLELHPPFFFGGAASKEYEEKELSEVIIIVGTAIITSLIASFFCCFFISWPLGGLLYLGAQAMGIKLGGSIGGVVGLVIICAVADMLWAVCGYYQLKSDWEHFSKEENNS